MYVIGEFVSDLQVQVQAKLSGPIFALVFEQVTSLRAGRSNGVNFSLTDDFRRTTLSF